MCNSCIQTNTMLSSYRESGYDPTKTTTLRNAFARQMRVRFSKLERAIVDAIDTKDGFGLRKEITVQQTFPNQFAFPTDPRKMKEFMLWLQRQIDKDLLTLGYMPQIGESVHDAWTDMYVLDSYKRGLIRARQELRKMDSTIPTLEETGGIHASMSTPFHLERVGLLYLRVYEDLKGITSQMSTQISRVLSQGMLDGDNPRTIARKLVRVISGMGEDLGVKDTLGRYIPARRRAEILARTEIIRAHHKAMVQEYRNWGLIGVQVQAEFRTAGDDRVCDLCQALEGNEYSLDEAENLIPVHPMCRCIILPFEIKI